jgi:hypothetical protein
VSIPQLEKRGTRVKRSVTCFRKEADEEAVKWVWRIVFQSVSSAEGEPDRVRRRFARAPRTPRNLTLNGAETCG